MLEDGTGKLGMVFCKLSAVRADVTLPRRLTRSKVTSRCHSKLPTSNFKQISTGLTKLEAP